MRPIFKKPLFWFALLLPIALFGPMWRLANKRPRVVGTLSREAFALATSKDGTQIAAATADGQVQLWSAREGRFVPLAMERGVGVSPYNGEGASLPAFSPDGKTLFVANAGCNNTSTRLLYAYSLPTRALAWSVATDYTDDLSSYSLSSDARRVVMRSYDVIKVLDISAAGTAHSRKNSAAARDFPVLARFVCRIHHKTGGSQLAAAAVLSADGQSVLVAEPSEALRFYSVTSGQMVSRLQPPGPTFGSPSGLSSPSLVMVSPSPDGRFVALCDNTSVALWNRATKTWGQAASGSSTPRSVAWAPDGQTLWTGGDSVQEWRANDLKLLRQLPVSGPVALSNDGRTLYTRSLAAPGQSSGVFAWNVG